LIAAAFMAAFVFAAPAAFAAKGKGPPLAGVWNIAPSGRASSSGDLHFRITRNDGSRPVDVMVPVRAGAEQQAIARNIRNALDSKLRGDRFNVELGAGDNVLVSDPRGQPNFSIELMDSNIQDLRVQVQSVTPAATPTVPPQGTPAEPPPPPTPNEAPGDVEPQPGDSTVVPSPGMGVPESSAPAPAPAPVPAPGAAAPPPGNAAPPPGNAAPSPGNAIPSPGSTAPPRPPAIETPAPTPEPVPEPPPPQR
jgi:hypothetical protein